MATTSRYHLVPEDNRPSEDESAADNGPLLPSILNDPTPPKKHFHISGHSTIYTRLAVICLLVPAFIIMITAGTPETIPVEVFGMICVVRNAHVLLSHFIFPCFRIRIEFVGRSPALPIQKNRSHWLTRRFVHIAIDILIWIPLFISTTVIGSRLKLCGTRPWLGPWYVCSNGAFLPGMVMTWMACGLYLFSIMDGGNPSSVTTSADFIYDEEMAAGDDVASVQAHGGLAIGTESRKSGAESPVIV